MTTSSKETTQLASQDVGLIFVREYYTFLNKKPHRLHAFYNNDSLYVRGDEGTVSSAVKGTEEIRKKIAECNFENCKVLITQVDSQASANGGILIQVLGEMCNNNGPSQKFSQTFFLATQTNGYYVLNDIFRFLKDEVDVDYYAYNQEGVALNDKNVVDSTASSTSTEIPKNDSTEEALIDAGENQNSDNLSHQQEADIHKSKKGENSKKLNNVHKEEPEVEENEGHVNKEDEEVKKEASDKKEEKSTTLTIETTPEPTQSQEKKKKPEDNKKLEQKKETSSTPPIAASPTTPSKPKTWANLTAAAATAVSPSNNTSPIPEKTVPASSALSSPSNPGNLNISTNNEELPPVEKSTHSQNKPRKEATQIFVKSVIESVTEEELLEAFNQCGQVKSCNISRSRNCAFVEFTTTEGCQEALSKHRIPLSGGHTVLAEERRYNNTNRYNSNNTNQGRNQSSEQRRSNTNARSRQNNQQRQNIQGGKARASPSNQQK